jgi:hypothetical protein
MGGNGDGQDDEMPPYSLKVEHVAYTGCGPAKSATTTTLRGAVVVDRSSAERLITRPSDGLMGYWSDGKGSILSASDIADALERAEAEAAAEARARDIDANIPSTDDGDGDGGGGGGG